MLFCFANAESGLGEPDGECDVQSLRSTDCVFPMAARQTSPGKQVRSVLRASIPGIGQYTVEPRAQSAVTGGHINHTVRLCQQPVKHVRRQCDQFETDQHDGQRQKEIH